MASIDQRKADNGSITYRVRVRLRGRPTEIASFTRLTDAKRWAQSTEAAIREGRHFKTAEAKRHSLGDLIDRYVKDVLDHRTNSTASSRLHLAWWKKRLGAYSLADVTPALIVEGRDALLSPHPVTGFKRADATVVRYLVS